MIPGKQYTPEVLMQIAWRRKWLIAIPAVTIALSVAAVAHYLPNRYQSDALILVVPQVVPQSYVRADTAPARLEDRLQSIEQQILSRTRLERIIQDFNLYATRRKTEIMEDVVDRMRQEDITVAPVKGDAFRVGFTADDPRAAMRVTERLASLFIDESLKDHENLAESTNQFLEAQLDDARGRLIENEKKLEEYRRQHNGELPSQVDSNMQGLHNTELQLQELLDSMNRDHDRRVLLERSIAEAGPMTSGATAAVASSDGKGPVMSEAAQLAAAQADLRALQLRLKPEHPEVVKATRRVAELEKLAAAEAAGRPASGSTGLTPAEAARQNHLQDMKADLDNLDRQIAAKEAEEQRLRGVMTAYQKRIEAAPTRETELTELTRDYDTLQQSYRSLLARKQDSQIAENLERRQIGEQFKIIDAARLPEKPVSPDRPRIYLLGVIAALAFGFACAAGAEYFDRSLRSEDDVRAALNLQVLATIPMLRAKSPKHYVRTALAASVGIAAIAGTAAMVWRFLR